MVRSLLEPVLECCCRRNALCQPDRIVEPTRVTPQIQRAAAFALLFCVVLSWGPIKHDLASPLRRPVAQRERVPLRSGLRVGRRRALLHVLMRGRSGLHPLHGAAHLSLVLRHTALHHVSERLDAKQRRFLPLRSRHISGCRTAAWVPQQQRCIGMQWIARCEQTLTSDCSASWQTAHGAHLQTAQPRILFAAGPILAIARIRLTIQI